MQNPLVRITYCMPAIGSRIKDIESKYYVALRCSVHRDLGTIIAANPSTILAIARLGDREKETLIRDLSTGPSTVSGRFRLRSVGACDPPASAGRARAAPAARGDRRSHRPAASQGLLARPRNSWPTGWAARWGPISGAIPNTSATRPVRDVGPDRLGRADDDPGRGRHARRHPRHPPPLLRVHPRRPGRSRRARDRRGGRTDRGAALLHRARRPPADSIATISTTWCVASGSTGGLR